MCAQRNGVRETTEAPTGWSSRTRDLAEEHPRVEDGAVHASDHHRDLPLEDHAQAGVGLALAEDPLALAELLLLHGSGQRLERLGREIGEERKAAERVGERGH